MSARLEVRGLLVRYPGHTALQVEHLAVEAGETLAIIGPNGSGKSTLLRVLALLQRPARGELSALGRPVRWRTGALLPIRRRMAAVFQAPLLTSASVADNVALGLRFRHVPSAESRRRVEEWLDRFGIRHLARRQAGTLSGGEAQRTSLARAFAVGPDVLFLDEPFAALDPPTREALLLDLEAVLREARITTVFVTHDRNEAMTLATRVAVMIGGRLIQVDTPRRVFHAPASLEVARFVGIQNTLAGAGEGGAVRIGGATLRTAAPAVPAGALVVCIRAERVTLSRASAHYMGPDDNVMLGTVTRIVPLAGHVEIHLDVGFPLRAAVPETAMPPLRLAPGSEVRASIPAWAVHVIGGGRADSRCS
ncbi:MAG: ABC transporter ATP-binding protein [Gemmatimonadales bacterium]